MGGRLYAVERYDDAGTAALADEPFPVLPGATRFTGAVYLRADEVVIAFVEIDDAVDEATVADTIRACGWRVDRIGPASWIAPPSNTPIRPAVSRTATNHEE